MSPLLDPSSARTVFGDTTRLPGSPADSRHTISGDTTGLPPSAGGIRQASPSKDATGPLQLSQQFSARYLIVRLLGIGGMGAVYQAWDAELSVMVALKVVRPEVTRDPTAARDVERRFKQELLLARQVTHRNVVRIHDLGEIDSIKYITMPYIEGEDLSSALKRSGRLPVASVMPIARQIASGLRAAHGAGVVHRDLKPANIMLEKDAEAIIMDFGIARTAARPEPSVAGAGRIGQLDASLEDDVTRAAATVAGAVVGTIEYMAPEQARGQEVDQRADIYAFGLIVYDMLVGRRRAEHAPSAIGELQKRLEQSPPSVTSIVPEVPEALDRLVSRCIEPDAAKRYATTADLVAALDRLGDDGKLRPVRRVVGLPLMAATVLVLLGLAGGTWWYQRQFIPPPQHDPVSVVIADFANTTGDPAFDNALGHTIRRGLEDASFISAYDRSRISALGLRAPEKLDEAAARTLALKQGLGVVLTGTIGRRGDGYEVSVKAAETVTGTVIADAGRRASNKDAVLETVTRLMATVRNKLGDETSESAQLFAMKSISTSSLEVLAHYAAGAEAQARGNQDEARKSYLAAVTLEPKFGLGYLSLAVTSRNLNQRDDADKYIKEALHYLDGMTDHEKFATRGYYYNMTGDYQQCAKEYGESLVRYPADNGARNLRAICLALLRRYREATDEMRQVVRMIPNHVSYRTNLAHLAVLTGNFQLAEDQISSLAQPSVRALLALAYSQLGRGLVREAAESYQKLATMSASGASVASLGLGDLAVYEGRFSDAVRIFERGSADDLASNTPDSAATEFAWMAYAHLMAGHKAQAIAAAEKARLNGRGMSDRFLAARVFVEAGAIDKARTVAAALSQELSTESQAHGKIIEGLIALKSGKPRDAITILSEANTLLDTWFGHFDLGRAYLAAGAFPQADSEFDRCIARRGEAITLMNEGPTYGHFPSVYYYQGLVREGMGTVSFADSYREYLKIRGNSTDDPLLPDVRRRVGS
ncbi:MAG TPA: protein kinase [Vicinamibacterales bacterium]|nr:protein kinase [Vicinamibacterales bacterium]